jgi:hypothetical protein
MNGLKKGARAAAAAATNVGKDVLEKVGDIESVARGVEQASVQTEGFALEWAKVWCVLRKGAIAIYRSPEEPKTKAEREATLEFVVCDDIVETYPTADQSSAGASAPATTTLDEGETTPTLLESYPFEFVIKTRDFVKHFFRASGDGDGASERARWLRAVEEDILPFNREGRLRAARGDG